MVSKYFTFDDDLVKCIDFKSPNDLKHFLLELDKEGITWASGVKASDIDQVYNGFTEHNERYLIVSEGPFDDLTLFYYTPPIEDWDKDTHIVVTYYIETEKEVSLY